MKKFYKRYYVLDFEAAKLIIKHDVCDYDESSNNQTIQFGSILSCSFICNGTDREGIKTYKYDVVDESNFDGFSESSYKFPFLIKLDNRDMILCAKTAEERQLWIAALEYAIVSTKKVQSIMR